MDNLARDAMLARQAGLSYGRWKAMQKPVKVTESPIPDGWRKCEFCGKPFKKSHGKRFCNIDCRNKAYKPRENELKAEHMRKYRERKGWKDVK